MLVEGKSVIDFENMSMILHFLIVDNFPKPIGQTCGWEMASCMHDLVVNKTKTLVEVVRFISLSCDEVTTFDQ
jgi:hypothetical protein